jgi:hypothetical protein
MPPGHAASLRAKRETSARDKRLIGIVLVALTALLIALVVSLVTAAPSSSNGCIYVVIPAATGAQQVNECGARARSTCESAKMPGTFTSNSAQSVVAACRKARLPVGP